jgi:hypothetical protein
MTSPHESTQLLSYAGFEIHAQKAAGIGTFVHHFPRLFPYNTRIVRLVFLGLRHIDGGPQARMTAKKCSTNPPWHCRRGVYAKYQSLFLCPSLRLCLDSFDLDLLAES